MTFTYRLIDSAAIYRKSSRQCIVAKRPPHYFVNCSIALKSFKSFGLFMFQSIISGAFRLTTHKAAMTFLHDVNVPTKKATFGMGCFWGVESLYGATKGVIRTRVGFTGGSKENPVYKNLGDHTEAVEIDYDPNVISYGELLDIFWSNHNPTAKMSKQYTSVIYYHDDEQKALAEKTLKEQQSKTQHVVVTTVEPAKTFYNAEDYHQKYRLQQHSFLMDAIQLKPVTEHLIKSHVAARLNGYVVGFGGVKQLEEEAEKLGLSGKVLDYVRNLVVRYEGQGLTC